MKNFLKTLCFLAIFSYVFYWVRTFGSLINYNVDTLIADLGGLTYLYSTIGIIFAIFAAFVILSESERWNDLTDAVKGEISELNELILWTKHLPSEAASKFKQHIKEYLESTIAEWNSKDNSTSEKAIVALHDDVFSVASIAPNLLDTTFSNFSDVIKYREKRLHHVSLHVPGILKFTLFLNDILLIGLSMLIGVRNLWLDYIFVGAVALLGYIIWLVVNDLDNPTRPGGWHLSSKDYQQLLNKIK